MISRNAALKTLYDWRTRHYFCPEAWTDRGLIRSPDRIPHLLNAAKVALVDDLLKAILSNADESQIRTIVLNRLSEEWNPTKFDTEEREFLSDCFHQIAISLELSNFGNPLQ